MTSNTPAPLRPSGLHVRIHPFRELSAGVLYEALKLRQDVFMLEQDCLYPELDGLDPRCLHVVGTAPAQTDDGETAVAAYARILPPGLKFEDVSIGRIVVDAAFRHRRYGRDLVAFCLEACRDRYPGAPVRIEAQEHLREFYARLGFVVTSPRFLLDGILHVNMVRTPSS